MQKNQLLVMLSFVGYTGLSLVGCTNIDDYENNVSKQALLDGYVLSNDLKEFAKLECGKSLLKVRLAFENYLDYKEIDYSLEFLEGSFFLNEKAVDMETINLFSTEMIAQRRNIATSISNARRMIANNVLNSGLIEENNLDEYINGNDTLNVTVDACQLQKLSQLDHLLAIELYEEPIDESLSTAMEATRVTPSLSWSYNQLGNNVGVYMTDLTCPNESFLNYSNYWPLSSTTDSFHSKMTTTILRSVSPLAAIVCKTGCTLPTSSEITDNSYPPIVLASYSCGYGDSAGYTLTDMNADDFMYNYGILIVKSAGNNGALTGNITSPGKAVNALTVGNYDDNENTEPYSIHATSSYVDPSNVHLMKPEVSAPGSYMNLNVNMTDYTNYGTSFASPHVSGMLANFYSSLLGNGSGFLWWNAGLLKIAAIVAATDSVSGGSDRVGVGGVDAYRLEGFDHISQFKLFNHTSFNAADATDSIPNNGQIDIYTSNIAASANSLVTVGIAWVVRGSYTFSSILSSFPIGSTYSIEVYNPNGVLVGSAVDYYNNFVVLKFNRSVGGQYHVVIKQVADRDTGARFKLAFVRYQDHVAYSF